MPSAYAILLSTLQILITNFLVILSFQTALHFHFTDMNYYGLIYLVLLITVARSTRTVPWCLKPSVILFNINSIIASLTVALISVCYYDNLLKQNGFEIGYNPEVTPPFDGMSVDVYMFISISVILFLFMIYQYIGERLPRFILSRISGK